MSESQSTKNAGEPWSDSDVQKLRELVEGNTPTRLIGLKLGRTINLVDRGSAKSLPGATLGRWQARPGLIGPIGLELARAEEQLPGPQGMPGGSRFELMWDGFLH